MAAALGVAMVSDTLSSVLIFNALALGFALPLTLLFFIPAVAKWLPKPGPWMVTFRQFLAFPMIATVIWLLWVYLSLTSGNAQFMLMASLLAMSLFFWLASSINKPIKKLFSLFALVFALGPIYLSLQQTQSAEVETAFSLQSLQQLRDENQVVFVNMTADWCITCKVSEQVAFTDDQVQQLLGDENVTYMVGDWTNKNDQILSFLNQHQRSGVPLYLVYAGNNEPRVLPQILTADIVIEAIQQAISEIQNEN